MLKRGVGSVQTRGAESPVISFTTLSEQKTMCTFGLSTRKVCTHSPFRVTRTHGGAHYKPLYRRS